MKNQNTMNSLLAAAKTVFKVLFKFLLLVPIPLFMMWFNFTVDRSGYFQGDQFEREVAAALLEGKDLSHYEKMDERQILKLYVQNLPEDQMPNTVALGSSRILQMSAGIAQAPSFFNAGMIGADVRDVMNSLYLFVRAGKIPQNVIIGIDPWLFSPSPEALDYRTDVELYQEFLSEALGHSSDYEAPDPVDLWNVITDPAYFQGNVEYYFRDKSNEKHPTVVEEEDLYHQDTEVKLRDGSVLYTEEFRNWSEDQVNGMATMQADSISAPYHFAELPQDRLELFDEFIQYGQAHGINFVFVLIPYHPLCYARLLDNLQKEPGGEGFLMVEPWLKDYAHKHGIPLYGSYDPFVLGLGSDDFYDGLHCRGTGIEKFFPGMYTVLLKQSGAALA